MEVFGTDLEVGKNKSLKSISLKKLVLTRPILEIQVNPDSFQLNK